MTATRGIRLRGRGVMFLRTCNADRASETSALAPRRRRNRRDAGADSCAFAAFFRILGRRALNNLRSTPYHDLTEVSGANPPPRLRPGWGAKSHYPGMNHAAGMPSRL